MFNLSLIHRQELCTLVKAFLLERQYILQHQEIDLEVALTVTERSVTTISTIANRIDSAVLNLNAYYSFTNFHSTVYGPQSTTRAANVLDRLMQEFNLETIRDVVLWRRYWIKLDPHSGEPTEEREYSSSDTDRQWLSLRTCGTTVLAAIDEWLSSMNLRRGMTEEELKQLPV